MTRELTQAEKATNYETLTHICAVRSLLYAVQCSLNLRGQVHDDSKLADPELATFVEFTPKLKGSTYGSDEYKGFLAAMKPALAHHYAHNPHHPEFVFAHEQWKPVVGYEGIYEVSDLGRVRSLDRTVARNGPQQGQLSVLSVIGGLRRAHVTPKGYLRIQLVKDGDRKNWMVHRLVATAFIPNPAALPEVNHKSGDKSDNSVSNLEWVTASGNLIHAYETGLKKANIKYVVFCDELDLATVGCEAMEREMRALGHERASASAIWRCINEEGARHLDFEFYSMPIGTLGDISPTSRMTIIDLIEMLADWKAATMRHADGCLRRSLFLNKTRFKIPDEIQAMLVKTADELGWLEPEWEYRTTEGQRKAWDGQPDLKVEGWEEWAPPGAAHWERWDFTETRTWRRRLLTPEGERVTYPGAAS